MYQIPFHIDMLTYNEALTLAHDTGFLGSTGDPLLETVVDMLEELGRPDKCFDVIQIAGTNGKSSTSRYTAAILRGEGLKTALYTSPELIEMRERMEIDGKVVSKGFFARAIGAAYAAGKRVNDKRSQSGLPPYRVTPFDLLTVAALVMFAEIGVDVAVLEVGLGGRWDATSATAPKATCITGIGYDHMHILGNSLEEIAGEKAAVIKPGQKCVLGVGTASPANVEDVFLRRAAEMGVKPILLRPQSLGDAAGEIEAGEMRKHPELPQASYIITRYPERIGGGLALDVITPEHTYEGLCAAKPQYQAANIACAVTLAEAYLGRELNQYKLSTTIGECSTPGRFNVVQGSPLHLVDAAHNPQSIRAFIASLRAMQPDVQKRPMLLCAVLKDKDVESIVDLLAPEFPRVAVTATQSPRALSASELATMFAMHGVEAQAYTNTESAVAALSDTAYIAIGSITLAGEVAKLHQHS